MASLLATFTFAGDLATGLEFEDGLRACYLADCIAEEMALPPPDRLTVYYGALIKDLGCTCWTTQEAEFWQSDEIAARRDLLFFGGNASLVNYVKWLGRYVGADLPLPARAARLAGVLRNGGGFLNEGFANASEACVRLAQRLGLPPSVQEATANVAEQWDGKGEPRRLKGHEIPLASRILLPTFMFVPAHRFAGRSAALELIPRTNGSVLDPAVAGALLRLCAREEFWEGFEREDILDAVLAREPQPPMATLDSHDIEAVALALADFTDLKAPHASAHSRRVAAITETVARLMRCSEEDVHRFRIAALLHDLGTVAVPSRALNLNASTLSPTETERMRLHPYYGERILARISELAPLIPLIGNHHEHMDGSGYFRGLKGAEIPLGARIIGIANRLDELTHDTPEGPAMTALEALQVLKTSEAVRYDKEVLDQVAACLKAVEPGPRVKREWPAGLTDREVEVLRLACKGLTRRQVAETLTISESTVRHHLEHIYDKTGATTRVGATLFAMENDLLA